MENVNSTIVILSDNECLVKQKLTKSRPNYFMVGNGTMNKQKIFGIDLLNEIVDSTKPAQWLLLAIKNGINYGNDYSPVVKIQRKELSSTHQQYLDKGYKELVAKDLVRRVKQGHYMINPNALIPPDYSEAIKIWNSVDKTTEDQS